MRVARVRRLTAPPTHPPNEEWLRCVAPHCCSFRPDTWRAQALPAWGPSCCARVRSSSLPWGRPSAAGVLLHRSKDTTGLMDFLVVAWGRRGPRLRGAASSTPCGQGGVPGCCVMLGRRSLAADPPMGGWCSAAAVCAHGRPGALAALLPRATLAPAVYTLPPVRRGCCLGGSRDVLLLHHAAPRIWCGPWCNKLYNRCLGGDRPCTVPGRQVAASLATLLPPHDLILPPHSSACGCLD